MKNACFALTVPAAHRFGGANKPRTKHRFSMPITATCLLLFCCPAFAITKYPVATIAPGALQGKCNTAGGNFEETTTGYSCTKTNCDGKGGDCVVGCGNDGKCAGQTPSTVRGGKDIWKVLGKIGARPIVPIKRGNSAPITRGNPVRAVGTGANPTTTTHPILEKGSGGGGGKLK